MTSNGWHVHFGMGRLTIGAVLPCLNSSLPLVVAVVASHDGQRKEQDEPDWLTLCGYKTVWVRNTSANIGGYNERFSCVHKTGDADVKVRDLKDKGKRVLLVVDDWRQLVPFLCEAASVSVSVGESQKTVEACLLESERRDPTAVLSFENLTQLNVDRLGAAGWTLYQVVTDRICTKRIRNLGPPEVVVQCEDYLSMIAANDASNFLNLDLKWDSVAQKGIRLVPGGNIDFYVRRKRGLVNSIHKIIALFCAQVLKGMRMSLRGQTLSVVQARLDKEPQLRHSLGVYARLQAIKLMWPLLYPPVKQPQTSVDVFMECYGSMHPQLVFDRMCCDIASARARFDSQPDELSRLLTRDFRKEVGNWKEFLRRPVTFAKSERTKIKSLQLYDKPSCSDMDGLDDVLAQAFGDAAEVAA